MYLTGLAVAAPAIDRLMMLMGSSDASRIASRVGDQLPALAPRLDELVEAVETERLKGPRLLPAYSTPEHLTDDERAEWRGKQLRSPSREVPSGSTS